MKTIILMISIIIMMSDLTAAEILASDCHSEDGKYSISISARASKLTLRHWNSGYAAPKKVFVSRMFHEVPNSRDFIEMRQVINPKDEIFGKSVFVKFNTKHMIRVNNTRYFCGSTYRIFFPGDWTFRGFN